MSAAALLTEAKASGVRLRLATDGKVKVAGRAPPDLLARLRDHKAELVELLRVDACRHCGAALDHALTGALPFADGTFAHVACHDAAEVARIRARAANAATPAALVDEAELAIRGELS